MTKTVTVTETGNMNVTGTGTGIISKYVPFSIRIGKLKILPYTLIQNIESFYM